MGRQSFIVLFLVLSCALVLVAGGFQIAVPSYIYAGRAGWDKIVADGGYKVHLALINPLNGPGPVIDYNFVTQANTARAAGVKLFGYVHSSYAAQPLADIKQNVTNYHNWYGVDNIFVDEASLWDCANVAYYQAIYDYVHARGGEVVMNSGGGLSECFVSTFDIALNGEMTWATYSGTWQPPAWVTKYDAKRFWHVVHATPASAMQSAIALAQSRHAGLFYLTDDAEPNPYDALPTYWSDFYSVAETVRDPTSVAFSSALMSSKKVGDSVTYTVAVANSRNPGVTPTGTVTFAFQPSAGAPTRCAGATGLQVTLSGGVATCTVLFPTAGSWATSALFGGSSITLGSSTTSASTIQVRYPVNVAFTTAPATSITGVSVPFAVQVTTSPSSSTVPGGSITFAFGTGSDVPTSCVGYSSLTVWPMNGIAWCTVKFPSAGARTVSAIYSGDALTLSAQGTSAISLTDPTSPPTIPPTSAAPSTSAVSASTATAATSPPSTTFLTVPPADMHSNTPSPVATTAFGRTTPAPSATTAPSIYVGQWNFAPASVASPSQFITDSGASYSEEKSNTLDVFGWNRPNPNIFERNSAQSPSKVYDTFAAMTDGKRLFSWDAAVPTSSYYAVHIISGDPVSFDCQDISVEDQSVLKGCPTGSNPWLEYSGVVAVSDGRLSLASGPSGLSKLCSVEVAYATGAVVNTVFTSIPPASRNGKRQASASANFISMLVRMTGEPAGRFLPLQTREANDTTVEVTYLIVDAHLIAMTNATHTAELTQRIVNANWALYQGVAASVVLSPEGPVPDAYAPSAPRSKSKGIPVAAIAVPCVLVVVIMIGAVVWVIIMVKRRRVATKSAATTSLRLEQPPSMINLLEGGGLTNSSDYVISLERVEK